MRTKAGSVDYNRARSGSKVLMRYSSSPFGDVGSTNRSSKKKAHNVSFAAAMCAGLVELRPINLPESIGEDDVFSYLTTTDILRLRATSKQFLEWSELCLSRRVEVELVEKDRCDEEAFTRLLHLCKSVQVLKIRGCHGLELSQQLGNAPSSIALRNLKTLVLHDCFELSIHPEMISALFEVCQCLEHVESNVLCAQSITVLGDRCGPSMKRLSCAGSGMRVTGDSIVQFATKCPNLVELNISTCGFGDHHLEALVQLQSIRKRLEVFDISNCNLLSTNANDEIINITNNNVDLETTTLSEGGVAAHIASMLALKYFFCDGLYPKRALFESLTRFRGFEATMEEDRQAEEIKSRQVKRKLVRAPFHTLRFGDCPQLGSPELLKGLAAACGHSLKVLELNRCKSISDINSLCELVRSCPNLEEIAIRGCEGVTSIFLRTIGESCPGLRKAVFSRCNQVNDGGIAALTQNCTQLGYVDFSGCASLTDQAMSHFATCTNLETLIVSCCSSLTNEGLDKSLQAQSSFRNLRHLDISWCFRITDASILAKLSQQCKRLRYLRLEGLSHFVVTDHVRIKSYRPGLILVESDDDLGAHEGFLPISRSDSCSSSSSSPIHRNLEIRSVSSDELMEGSNNNVNPKSLRRKSSGSGKKHFFVWQPSGLTPHKHKNNFSFFEDADSFVIDGKVMQQDQRVPHGDEEDEEKPIFHGRPADLQRRISLDELERLEEKIPSQTSPVSFHDSLSSSMKENRLFGPTVATTTLMGRFRSKSVANPMDKYQDNQMHRRFGDFQQDIDRLNAFANLGKRD